MRTHGPSGRHGQRGSAASLLALATLLAAGCAAPFSDLQSAGLMEPGETEITAHYSRVGFANDGEMEGVQNNLGLQVGYGLSDVFEIRGRTEVISLVDDGDGVDLTAVVVGIGPKVRLIEDRLALHVPVGTAFGRDIETGESWAVHPTIIWTLPVSDVVEINGSGKVQIRFEELDDPFWAGNVGVRIAFPGWPIALRPEAGILMSPGDEGVFYHFSLGASLIR